MNLEILSIRNYELTICFQISLQASSFSKYKDETQKTIELLSKTKSDLTENIERLEEVR